MSDLVEAQVARTPSAPAVVAGAESLTYAELDVAANRLAHHLQSLGVGPDAVVGVCLERSVRLAVALVAVLKAGGACLPLDPSYPAERLAQLVGHAATVAVVTSAALAPRLTPAARVVCLEDAAASLVALPDSAPSRAVGADHVAYVIYTSGSTGAPKGVLLTHAGLVNHHRAAVALYDLGPGDRVLQFCSLAFDASIEELFPTWAAGATVVFRPDDVPLLGRAWTGWLDEQAITVVNLPTGYWHEWARDIERRGARTPASLRLVVVGGEKAMASALRTWVRAGGGRARWINAYGPTEATCMATTWEADFAHLDASDPPIGRPLPNVVVRVVDAIGDPVSPGCSGELLIGGAGLARGYLNDPELTADRFVADPAGPPGSRLHRTGDLVHHGLSGDLEFLGRLDGQVKIRGFRVECGEVEAALARYPAVVEAVVVARGESLGEKRLVAYTILDGATPAGPTELRRFLAGILPAHMVPAAFVTVDAFPRNRSGKVDRDGLPAPDPKVASSGRPRLPPRTATEAKVAAIWARVLGLDVEGIGVHDDFFDLGGHSLLAMQVIAQVRDEFGTDTPLHAVFEAPTPAGLAALVAADNVTKRRLPPLTAQRRQPGGRLPLSLAQEQMCDLEATADPPGLYNITALQRLDRPVDEDALRAALAYMMDRHEALRTTISRGPAGPYQVVHPGAPVQVGTSDLGHVAIDDRPAALHRRIADEDARPFVLGQAPLFRARLFHLDDQSSTLAVTFDHLICDGTGAYIFLSELAAAYKAIAASRTPDLPPLELQPADFAIWQRRHVTEDVLRSQVDWWAGALQGMPLGPAVPFDHVPGTPTRRIASREVTVSAGTRSRLEGLARATGSTVFVVAAAAVQALSSRWGKMTDIALSTTLSGRRQPQLDGLIGMFSGIARIRADLSGDPTFAEIVERTRHFVFLLFENQDVPFMRVRRELLPDFPSGGPALAAALPIELQYFRTASEHRAPGAAVVDHPGGGRRDQTLFFRGQLHPLSITLLDDGARLWGKLSYKLDFYEPATIDHLGCSLECVVEAVAQDPSLRLATLPVAPPD